MNKFLKSLLVIAVFSFLVILFNKYYFKDYNIEVIDKNMECKLKYKGLKNAVDFTLDDNGDYYIVFKNKIQYIDSHGKSYILFADNSMEINSVEYYKNKLYFTSKSSVYSYDLYNKKCKSIIDDLPNFGDYNKSIVKVNGQYLYITIGAATNSGVVGKDNEWIKNNPYNHDISPYKIVLNGINFENGKTGAFVNYGSKTIQGQIIPGHFPGNASIIMYNLDNNVSGTYAWGIRNVKGMDFDSRGRIIASVGGMEDRGLRPVKGDTDYIYVIKQKSWYGWPDYSGGDPLNSPRFKGSNNKSIYFILDNHPTTNPGAPLYVHKKLDALKGVAVDKTGTLGEIDSVYFYDDMDKKIWYLNDKGVLKEKIKFNSFSEISSIKYVKNQIIILDSAKGNLFKLGLLNKEKVISNNKPIIYFFIIAILIAIISLLIILMNMRHISKKE
ncbi:hypothetical protein RBU49_09990 [Clostridium sp. MB40-C1]|uniref:hypothetical protein n=1 Tax=Clostridium sp. MB40-C1 TaxID=3070996 RepID=UPI0027DF7338|nr:hypothetical protein [Clostridium sp. MB40-C1]WMJ79219.1 hypothetical protein RBU49_09990 [Clostridium sp. MB40-C1]